MLKNQRVARIATSNPDGTIHVVPIHYAWDGRYIYSVLSRKSRRLDNIVRGSRISILVDTYEEKPRGRFPSAVVTQGVLMYGTAQILEFESQKCSSMRGWTALTRKYPRYISWLTNSDSTPKDPATWKIMRFGPQKTIAFT